MDGANTLSKLYLGSDPVSVKVQGDQLLIILEDEQTITIPLHFVSQLRSGAPLPEETQLLVLTHPPQIDLVRLFVGGKSTESERSIQQWLQSRQTRPSADAERETLSN